MRQNIALLFFIVGIDYLIKKQRIQYIITIYLATLFHSSAYILFALLFTSNIKIKANALSGLIFFAFIYFLYFNQALVFQSLVGFITQDNVLSVYTVYTEEDANFKIGLGFLLANFLYIVIFLNLKNLKGGQDIFLKLGLIYIIVDFISFALPLALRYNLYFSLPLIVLYIYTMKSFNKNIYNYGFMLAIAVLTMYQFFIFFESDVWKLKFSEYQTIFSAPDFY